MKLEGELAVTFCARALSSFDLGISFDTAELQHHLRHFTAERSQYCAIEQNYPRVAKELAAEKRPDFCSQPALHQLKVRTTPERNDRKYLVSRLDASSQQQGATMIKFPDHDKTIAVGRSGDNPKHHSYLCRCSGEDFDEHCDVVLDRPNTVAPCCCLHNYSKASGEDGSSRVLADAERPPVCKFLLEFPLTIMANASSLVVGYALTAKKAESFLKPALLALARSKGIVFSVVDYDKPLLEQGPFDVILHKITRDVWHQHLKAYKEKNPKVFIFDPPEAIKRVYNRKSMLQGVADLKFQHPQGKVGVPKQLVVNGDSSYISEEVARENLRFPLVVKPLWIDGTAKSHALSLAYNKSGLSNLTTPLVLQEFVNHGGVMFKVYVVGHLIKVVHRPSLSDVCGDEAGETGVMAFPRVSSAAALAAESELNPGAIEYPPEEMLFSLANKLKAKLGLNLFNFDIIRDSRHDDQYYVIDINYFPGYGKVPDYEKLFTEFLSSLTSYREPE